MGDMVLCYLEGLGNTKEEFEGCIKRLEKLYTGLENDVKSLDTMWEGPAHDNYKNEWKNCLEGLRALIDQYKGILEYEDKAYTEYVKATDKAQDVVKTMK